MKVLITGITGFVGSHLADYILDNSREAEVFGMKRWHSPMQNIEHIKDKLKLYDCDLRDLSSMISILKEAMPDKIFHLAAQSYIPYSYTTPIDTLTTNVIGTANLLEAIRLTEQDSLIHICSSSEIYGQVREEDMPIKETQPLNPFSPYGVSKVAEDLLGLTYYTAYGMKIVRTRAFSHTGARRGEVFVCSDFAKQIARIEIGAQEPVIYTGNLDSIRTFADVRDIVRAYWMLNRGMAGEAFNIGGNTTVAIKEVLNELIKLAQIGEHITVKELPSKVRSIDITLQVPDSTKFKKVTGWEPKIPFEETLEDLLNYWRERV